MSMSAAGVSQEEIAMVIGVSTPTLRKHYGEEWALGRIRANAAVGRSLYDQAVGRPAEYERDKDGKLVFDRYGRAILIKDELKPVPACGMFWAKTQMGWKEARHEDDPEDRKPTAFTPQQARSVMETLPEEEQEAVKKFLAALRAAKPVIHTEDTKK
jgi:hypothetical protein